MRSLTLILEGSKDGKIWIEIARLSTPILSPSSPIDVSKYKFKFIRYKVGEGGKDA